MDKYLETITHFAGTDSNKDELLAAREGFFEQMGIVTEEEDKYEENLNRFLDWYLFDRPLISTGKPPVESFYERFHRTFSPEDEVIYDGFRKSFQSLFIVKKSDDEGIWVKDLIYKRKHFVEDDVPKGFFRDEIFQVRLIPQGDKFRFGDSFCFHPLVTNKILLKRVKKLDRENPEQVRSFLAGLQKQRMNSERYRHVDIVRFYEEDI